MTVSQATAEVFLTALRALPTEERQAVLAHIVSKMRSGRRTSKTWLSSRNGEANHPVPFPPTSRNTEHAKPPGSCRFALTASLLRVGSRNEAPLSHLR